MSSREAPPKLFSIKSSYLDKWHLQLVEEVVMSGDEDGIADVYSVAGMILLTNIVDKQTDGRLSHSSHSSLQLTASRLAREAAPDPCS